jgi:hypothetical protein
MTECHSSDLADLADALADDLADLADLAESSEESLIWPAASTRSALDATNETVPED